MFGIDTATIMPVVSAIFVLFIILMGMAGLFKAFYVKVPQGTALLVNDMSSTPKVHFTGALVYPIIYKKEFMKISLITLEVDRRGQDGLICRDNMRADITVAFYLRVNETPQDVLKVAKAIGVDRASDKAAVNELFNAKFSEALKTVGKQIDFVSLFEDRITFREKIIQTIGEDLNGYVLEDVAIDYLEQTPKGALDPNNILDAEGIRKITELTAAQNVQTNELARNEELAITKKNVETKEALLELERQQADAEFRQKREVETVQAREQAETIKVQQEENLRAEQARIASQQEIEVREENRMREVEVAQQNRQRAVAIEEEKVTRARELEIVARQKEVELEQIDKEKAVEHEKMQIANVIRERVAVEKTVAEEEERIKEVRVVSEADRQRQATIIIAEAEAQETLVKEVKQAEADEQKSRHKAIEINTIAQAELEAASKEAEAKKRIAEGVEAEQAAPGLAAARVKDVTADAMEKEGLAEARVLEQKMSAQATGEEQMGLARAKADREIGLASAEVVLEKFKAEAEGLVEKFKAMEAMSETARSHEEFRMELEKNFEEAIARITANQEIAKDQAEVLSTALEKANIDIVGGEGDFFDSFAKGLSVGKAIDGAVGKSAVLKELLDRVNTLAQGGKSGDSD